MDSASQFTTDRIKADVSFLIAKDFRDELFSPSVQAIMLEAGIDATDIAKIFYAGVNSGIKATSIAPTFHFEPLELAEMHSRNMDEVL